MFLTRIWTDGFSYIWLSNPAFGGILAVSNIVTVSSGFDGSLPINNLQDYFSIQIGYSGIDNTQPISVNLSINYSSGSLNEIILGILW